MRLYALLSDFIASNYDLARISSRELLRVRLIHLISVFFIAITFAMFFSNYHLGLGKINGILLICDFLGLYNLYWLYKKKNIVISAHVVILIVYIASLVINMICGGVDSSYFLWFTSIPIMAAILIGCRGLLFYSALTLLTLITFFTFQIPSDSLLSTIAPYFVSLNNFLNYLFFITTLTAILFALLQEQIYYEKTLEDHNVKLRSSENKYRFLAHHDELTNLPNRNYLQEKLQELIKQDQYRNKKVTIFFMDLDNLKHINDNHGHKTGDVVLLLVGRRLKQCFRSEDIIARVGGDEFIGITLENESDFSMTVAKRILTEIRRPFRCDNHIVETSLSIGIAAYPLNGNNISDVIEVADEMLYKVKRAGKNNFAIA